MIGYWNVVYCHYNDTVKWPLPCHLKWSLVGSGPEGQTCISGLLTHSWSFKIRVTSEKKEWYVDKVWALGKGHRNLSAFPLDDCWSIVLKVVKYPPSGMLTRLLRILNIMVILVLARDSVRVSHSGCACRIKWLRWVPSSGIAADATSDLQCGLHTTAAFYILSRSVIDGISLDFICFHDLPRFLCRTARVSVVVVGVNGFGFPW